MTTKENLYVNQGTDFATTLELTQDSGDDYSEYNFYCDVCKLYSNTKKFSAELTVLTNGSVNELELRFSKETTSYLEGGKYTYDVMMENPVGSVSKILEGLIFLIPSSTIVGANT